MENNPPIDNNKLERKIPHVVSVSLASGIITLIIFGSFSKDATE